MLKRISEFPALNLKIGDAMERWKNITLKPDFITNHHINGIATFPYLSGDDPDDYDEPWMVSLLNSEEIDFHWKERKEEGFGGESSFMIGRLDGNGHDDAIFLSTHLLKGVAIMHHDDIFSADNLDTAVNAEIEKLGLHTERFVELLRESRSSD